MFLHFFVARYVFFKRKQMVVQMRMVDMVTEIFQCLVCNTTNNVGGIAAIFENNLQQTNNQIQNVLGGVSFDRIGSN